MVRVHLPKSLRAYWSGPEVVDVDARNLADVFANLNRSYPGLGDRIVDDQGNVRPYVHVFVNFKAVPAGPPGQILVASGDAVHILPSVAGGASGTESTR
jgi:molybdopterin synthase sulfur carrier subunit